MFECSPDDSKSVIYRSKVGFDTEIENARMIATIGREIVKELRRGDSPYKMRIKTDVSPQPRLVRFTHV